MSDSSPHTLDFRSGYVAIVGDPNAGKSTLMNSLLGEKLSIVTPKPQTTRHTILGILNTEHAQIVFLDTPGIIRPRYLLQDAMMKAAASAIGDADVVVLMVDAARSAEGRAVEESESFRLLNGVRKPVLLVLNKVDLMEKPALLPIMESSSKVFPFDEIIPVSALTGDGTAALVQAILTRLPVHPPYYPTDVMSEQHERFFVAEIVREKIFLKLRDEIPYSSAVSIVAFEERTGGKWYIDAEITVERESQRRVLIGAGGSMIKTIGSLARKDIEALLGHAVFLQLHAKVRKEWRSDEAWLKRLGYGPERS